MHNIRRRTLKGGDKKNKTVTERPKNGVIQG